MIVRRDPFYTTNTAVLEISLLPSLACCTLPDPPACTLNPPSSKPSKPCGQHISLLKILKGLPIASKEQKVQPACQERPSSPWSPLDSSNLISCSSTGRHL